MTLFQLILLIGAGAIFYFFFKQLFGGQYPKRGVDFDAKVPDSRIGGLMEPSKTFGRPATERSRVEELLDLADGAAEKNDWLEVKKAMQSAQILDPGNIEVLHRLGIALLQMHDFAEAKKSFEAILALEPNNDMAEVSLANTLHKLGEDEAAILHHRKAVELDATYAPHFYNYANTLYDLDRKTEALELYRQALTIDPGLSEAQKMIEELQNADR